MAKCKVETCFESELICHGGFCKRHDKCQHKLLDYSAGPVPRRVFPAPQGHLGVELEVCGYSSSAMGELIRAYRWCCADGSLADHGVELKLLTNTRSGPSRAACLSELAGRFARADRSCGLHVNLDMSGNWVSPTGECYPFYSGRATECWQWLARNEDFFASVTPPNRWGSSYVARVGGRDCAATDHYSWANLSRRNRLEIRCHPSTTNPNKLRAWVGAMSDLCQLFRSAASLPPDPWGAFRDPLAVSYLRARMAGNGVLRTTAGLRLEEEAETCVA